MTPVRVKITSKTTGRSVVLIVRDFCGACRQGRSIIDMSPLGFIALGHDLGKGTDKVFIRYLREGR
jgi:rare lipoprotein A (peptidoglycan hydrolase)